MVGALSWWNLQVQTLGADAAYALSWDELKEMMGGMGINSIEALRGNRLMLRGIGLTDRELNILGIKHAGE